MKIKIKIKSKIKKYHLRNKWLKTIKILINLLKLFIKKIIKQLI